MSAAYVYDAVRTPFGRYGGALAGVRRDDLAAHVVGELVARSPALDPARIDDVLFGDANQAGEDNRDVARMAVLLAGLRAPGVLPKVEQPYATGSQTVHSTTLGWRMVNPKMPAQWTIALGESTEKLAGIHAIGREAQDRFALRSHRLTARAWDQGFYDWVVPVPGTELESDENVRHDTSLEKLAKLKPAFVEDGTVTAGNASPLTDGACALLLGDESAADRLGRQPLARVAGRGTHAVDPDAFGIAPVEAASKALARAGIGWRDVEVVELNEAFAAQSLACLGEWKELDPGRVNVNGGAIAVGHPLGASGVRILATLAYELEGRGGGYGVAAICIGVGQGLAVVLHA